MTIVIPPVKTFDDHQFYEIAEITSVFPLSRSKFYEMRQCGQMPKPLKLGEKKSAYRGCDLNAAIERMLENQGLPTATAIAD